MATRLDHSQICGRGRLDLALLGRTDCGVALAGVMLQDRGRGFHQDGPFMGQAGVFSDVDGDVCVERLQRFGEELVGERVEAVRAPVEPGPFQKVKSSKTSTPKFDIAGRVFAYLCTQTQNSMLDVVTEYMLAFSPSAVKISKRLSLKLIKGLLGGRTRSVLIMFESYSPANVTIVQQWQLL